MERSHTVVEAPDVFRWTLVETVTVDDIRRLFAEQAAFFKDRTRIYLIVDLQHLKQIGTEARRETVRAPLVDGKPMKAHAIAIVGGSFHFRLLGKMINKASALLHRIEESRVEFFDTLEQAREWIEKDREAKPSA